MNEEVNAAISLIEVRSFRWVAGDPIFFKKWLGTNIRVL